MTFHHLNCLNWHSCSQHKRSRNSRNVVVNMCQKREVAEAAQQCALYNAVRTISLCSTSYIIVSNMQSLLAGHCHVSSQRPLHLMLLLAVAHLQLDCNVTCVCYTQSVAFDPVAAPPECVADLCRGKQWLFRPDMQEHCDGHYASLHLSVIQLTIISQQLTQLTTVLNTE